MSSNLRVRNWCFTLNNPNQDDETRLRNCVTDNTARYVIYGRETSPSGTRHLQGYIEFTTSVRFNRAKLLVGERAHLEPRKGTPDQAREYCQKEGDYSEYGIPSSLRTGGARSGFASAVESVKLGLREGDLAQQHPGEYVRYNRGFRQLSQALRGRERRGNVCRIWLFGGTGVGKSFAAWKIIKESPVQWFAKHTSKWFDGYCGEQAIYWDELRQDDFPKFSDFLRVFDEYQCQVETKGGMTWLNANIWLITTPEDIEHTFTTSENIGQMKRRFTEIEMTEENRVATLDDLEQLFGEAYEIDLNTEES